MEAIPVAELGSRAGTSKFSLSTTGRPTGPASSRELGAHVCRPTRSLGYGNAYKAGFANSTGHVIATGDADCPRVPSMRCLSCSNISLTTTSTF